MTENIAVRSELTDLCHSAKAMTLGGEYKECRTLLSEAMCQYPDDPEPHNLLGLLLERCGDHTGAMKHFRAAWALDPSYRPVQKNLDVFSMYPTKGQGFYSEEECRPPEHTCVVICDTRGFSRCVRR